MAPLLALTAACASLLYTPALPAQEAPFGTPRVRARVLLDTHALAPGESTWGLLELEPQPGWHVYWRQPGDSGEPPRVDWQLPPGLRAGALQHPAPTLYREGPLAQFIHPGSVGLPFRLSADADFVAPPDGSSAWKLEASASWLVCKDVCEFELESFELDLAWRAPGPRAPESEGAEPGPPEPEVASIAAAVAKLPLRLDPRDWSATRSSDGSIWSFELDALPAAAAERLPEAARTWRAFERAEFFPVVADSVPFGVPVTALATQADSLSFTTAAVPPGPGAADANVRPAGVLVLRGPGGLELALELPPSDPSPPAPASGDASAAPPSRSATF